MSPQYVRASHRFTYARPVSSGSPSSRAMTSAASRAAVPSSHCAGHGQRQAQRVEGVALGLAGADQAGHVDGRPAALDGLGRPVQEHQHLAVAGQDPGALGGRRIGRDDRHGRLDDGHRLGALAVGPERPRQALHAHRALDRVGVVGQGRGRLAVPGDGPPRVAGQPRRTRRPIEQGRPIDAGGRLRVVDRGPQLEGVLGVATGVGEGERIGCGRARPDRRLERPAVVAGRPPVVGQLGPVAGRRGALGHGPSRDLVRDRAMQAQPLAGQQIVVGRLLEQRVAEAIARPGDQDLALDGLSQGAVQVVVRQTRDRGQEVVVHAVAGHGHHGQHRADVVGQGPEAGGQDLAQGRGQAAVARPLLGREQLLDEERVAVGALVDAPDGGAIGRRAQDGQRQIGRGRLVEPLEVDALGAAGALQLGQPRAHRVAAVQLVRADGQGQGDALGAQAAHEVGDGVAGRRVGPVEVLDDEQQRLALAQAMDDAQDGLQQARLGPLGLGADARAGRLRLARGQVRGERRDEPGQVRPIRTDDVQPRLGRQVVGQAAQGFDQRAVGQTALADVGARAAQHAHPVRLGHRGQLGDQPGLADAGLAGDEQVGRACPPTAAASASPARASSRSRPTMVGLTSRPLMRPMIPTVGATTVRALRATGSGRVTPLVEARRGRGPRPARPAIGGRARTAGSPGAAAWRPRSRR